MLSEFGTVLSYGIGRYVFKYFTLLKNLVKFLLDKIKEIQKLHRFMLDLNHSLLSFQHFQVKFAHI